MFLGEYTHTIDDKGRLTIPAKYRGDLAAGLVLTLGFDQNLMLFPIQGWRDLAERITAQSITDKRMREFRRRLFSAASNLTPDKQGRILIPSNLRSFGAIDSTAVIVGMYNYVEIWGDGLWSAQRSEFEHPDDNEYWSNLGF